MVNKAAVLKWLEGLRFNLNVQFGSAVFFLVLFIVVLISTFFINHEKSSLTLEVEKRILEQSRGLAMSSTNDVLQTETDVLSLSAQVADFQRRNNEFHEVSIVNNKNKIIGHTDVLKVGKTFIFPDGLIPVSLPFLMTAEKFYFLKEDYFIQIPILHQEVMLGNIYAQFSRKYIVDIVRNASKKIVFIAMGVMLLSLFTSFMLGTYIGKPIIQLTRGVRYIGQGHLEYKIDIRSRNEIGQLAGAFNQMTSQLKNAVDELVEKKTLEHELKIAQKIQNAMLPKEIPQIPSMEINIFYESARTVGGDYYDIFWVDKQHLGVVVADVSGKSIPAAMVMTLTRSLLREKVTDNLSPVEVLSNMNKILRTNVQLDMFVTMLYLIINVKNNSLEMANAGHLPLLHYQQKTKRMQIYKPNGLALAISDTDFFRSKIESMTVKLAAGDLLLLNTDGVNEARSRESKMFGDAHLYQFVEKNGNLSSPHFIDRLKKELTTFTDGIQQSDDITMLAVKIK